MQVDNSELRTILNPYFATRKDFYDPVVSLARTTAFILSMTGLRGFWPPSGIHPDGQANHLLNLAAAFTTSSHLTLDGSPTARMQGGTRPQIAFSGSAQWASSGDAPMWDILGTEAYIDTAWRGLTMGAWVWFDGAASSYEYAMSKRQSAEMSYYLGRDASGFGEFIISNDGTTSGGGASSSTDVISGGAWVFMCGRFDPSTEVKLYLNDEEYIDNTSIAASIYSGSADFFMAGRDDAATPGQFLLDGTISMAWICATRLEDETIRSLYEISKPIYDTYWEP